MTLPAFIPHPVHAAAVAAWHAGLCPVPTAVDGSKRPSQLWKKYQTERPTLQQIDQWFEGGHPGFGVICGAVSGNLEMFELEGRAVEEGMWDEFCRRCDAAGLGDVLDRIVYGYSEETPSAGIHLLLQVVDGPALGNLKLARRADFQVLFETRGEGGFVVLAPSGGPTHPSGLNWEARNGTLATIATITCAERDALYAVARSFDEAPEKVTPLPEPIEIRPWRPTNGHSWVDQVCAELAMRPWGDILGRYGYTWHHDAGEVSYWRHPTAKSPHGHSATTNAKGTDRLIMFSTSTPLEEYSGIGPAPSYDRLDVIAAYEHHGDRMEAARRLGDQYGLRPTSPNGIRLRPPANVDPVTGEILSTGGLDDDFWTARDYLRHIHRAAHARLVAPTAVLGCILARVAAFTPPSTRIPPIIGADAPLSTYVALLARSGGGKSSATGCAANLLPDTPAGCVGPLSLGSGEGLIDAYFEMIEDVDGGGKKTKVKRQTKRGALFALDEGQALAEMGNRRGSTILPVLRSAWSGTDTGQANASIETRRNLRAGSYALGVVSLWQANAAAELIRDADGGTPQRFVFIDTIDPTIDENNTPEWPGPLDWAPPAGIAISGIHQPNHLDVHADIVAEVRQAHAAAQRGEIDIEPLDAHRRLVKLKVAGLLAVLDGRHDIDLDDWQLAERIMRHSDSVRAWVIAEAGRRAAAVEEAGTRRQIAKEAAIETSAAERALNGAAKAIYRAAKRAGGTPISKRQIHHAIASRDRQHVTVDDAITEAERLRWVLRVSDNEWKEGDAAPK